VGVALVGLLGLAPGVLAQTTVNPRRIVFEPDLPSHAGVFLGVPIVSRYELRILEAGAAAPVSVVDLGKPEPDAAGVIRAEPAVLVGLPVGRTFSAVVAAIGPAGEGVSEPSNFFGRAAPIPAPARLRVEP
jgi:hypothetical protein